MTYKNLIFDLDGTLWDPVIPIAEAWNRVLKSNQIDFRVITSGDIRRIAGLPHFDCVRTIFEGLPIELIELISRETQKERGIFEEERLPLFPGVANGITALSKLYKLYIVSNCQSGYIEGFLEKSTLRDQFADWECWGDTGRSKAENLKDLALRNQLSDSAFIGDTEGDERAANLAQIPFYFVTFGYGNSQRPVKSFDDFPTLTSYFLNL